MTLPLRQRRRQETAREIQKATLELAVQNGLENITTEQISVASGVSTRTFFNYYANKEAAAIGQPPGFSEEDKDILRHGSGPVGADIKRLLDRHIQVLAQQEDILRKIGKVLQSNEKARGILERFLVVDREDLTEALCGRVNDRETAAALANKITSAIGSAIYRWEHEEAMSLADALDVIWAGTINASRILVSPDDG